MGVEVAKANLDFAEVQTDKDMSVDSENVSIKFGSHGVDETVEWQSDKVAESNLPTDVADEWPEPSQIYSFYFVRYRAFEDPNLKAKLDLADKELQKKNQLRSQIIDKLRAKRADRSELLAQIRALSAENKQFKSIMDEKRKEIEPLTKALGKLRGSGGRDRGAVICSSEEELNEVIRSLHYRIQHESIPLSEEKQILREIKQLEGTREKVIANATERAQIQDTMGEKDAIRDQVKLIGVDLDGAKKEKQANNVKLKQLDEAKLAIEKEISALETELTAVSQKRDTVFETIKDLRKLREEGNAPFYQNRTLLTKAKSLAANKDLDALTELSTTEVEKFMPLWNTNKDFRDDYERRILPSLDTRQMSKDGRMRNPGEKPLVLPEAPAPETRVVEKSVKQTVQEDAVPLAQIDTSEQKVQKAKGAKNQKEGSKKETNVEETEPADQEYYSSNKSQMEKKDEVDEQKLKEMKRQEEIAKRKQAEERKKKLAEKAAAKAAIKAQKEAEKKLKEREKRAKKKTGGGATTADPEESTEATVEAAEPEKIEEKVEIPAPQKSKDTKDSTIRHRNRPRGQKPLPKAILKRKKATNYWLWGGAAAAALLALILAIVGYRYLNLKSSET
ncbi:proton pump-interactor 1-like [Andrographis paniculata]|uniref:proton pump-interactor 1-like n=1 Tax=Andrographis paniculata TaxID=175694 RepID=UPI0021E6DA4E|nr:proton pump-interactor 1-like [Andrographis paniculata]